MKTFLLALSACTLAAFSSYAQTSAADTTAALPLKPQAKSFATELNVNPFTGSLSLNNSINQLKFRYFTAANFAIRLGVNGSRIGNSSEITNPYGTNSYHYENEQSSSTVGLNLGVEKHFAGTKRLSPYIGADVAVVNKSSRQEMTENQITTTITGAWREYNYDPYNPAYSNYTYDGERGYFRYGINLVTGFDFYMARKFFFGYEMNFGFSQTTLKEVEVKQTGTGSSSPNNRDTKNSAFSYGPSLMNGVRIGYVF